MVTPSHFGKKSLDLLGNSDFGVHQTFSGGNNRDVQNLIDQDKEDQQAMEGEVNKQEQLIIGNQLIEEEQELTQDAPIFGTQYRTSYARRLNLIHDAAGDENLDTEE